MKIKVTGINGYLGKLISERLVAERHDVFGIKREWLYGSTENLANEVSGCNVFRNIGIKKPSVC